MKPPIKELDKATIRNCSYVIGIDTGTNTGVCVWNRKEKHIRYMATLPIHKAMEEVKTFANFYQKEGVFIRVEDARLAVHGRTGRTDANKLQGAGSIKRDAKIWEDFLTDLGVKFEMVRPNKKLTKINSAYFNKISGWTGRSNTHERDSAMLVIGS